MCPLLSAEGLAESVLPFSHSGSPSHIALPVRNGLSVDWNARKQLLCHEATSTMTRGDFGCICNLLSRHVYTLHMSSTLLSGYCLVAACLGVQAMLVEPCICLWSQPARYTCERSRRASWSCLCSMPASQVRTQHSAVNGAVLASALPAAKSTGITIMAMNTSIACLAIVMVVQPPLLLGTAGAVNWQLCHAASANTLVISKLHATHLLQ